MFKGGRGGGEGGGGEEEGKKKEEKKETRCAKCDIVFKVIAVLPTPIRSEA